MMHVGIPWWFTHGVMQFKSTLVMGTLPLHKRKGKVPILYVRESPAPTFRSVECPVEIKEYGV